MQVLMMHCHFHCYFQTMAGKASVCEGCPGQALCSQQGKEAQFVLYH